MRASNILDHYRNQDFFQTEYQRMTHIAHIFVQSEINKYARAHEIDKKFFHMREIKIPFTFIYHVYIILRHDQHYVLACHDGDPW